MGLLVYEIDHLVMIYAALVDAIQFGVRRALKSRCRYKRVAGLGSEPTGAVAVKRAPRVAVGMTSNFWSSVGGFADAGPGAPG